MITVCLFLPRCLSSSPPPPSDYHYVSYSDSHSLLCSKSPFHALPSTAISRTQTQMHSLFSLFSTLYLKHMCTQTSSNTNKLTPSPPLTYARAHTHTLTHTLLFTPVNVSSSWHSFLFSNIWDSSQECNSQECNRHRNSYHSLDPS